MTNAYDFVRFEKKPHSEKMAAVQSRTAAKPLPKKDFVNLKFLALALFMLAIAVHGIYGMVELNDITDKLDSCANEYDVLNSEYVRLKTDLDAKVSLRKVEEVAANELGMSKIESYQVEYINLNEDAQSSTIKIENDTDFFKSVKTVINSIVEYIAAI